LYIRFILYFLSPSPATVNGIRLAGDNSFALLLQTGISEADLQVGSARELRDELAEVIVSLDT
jgi:hypothetical protein